MLSGSQFLPGMEAMRQADPHEQTEAQFHNRPNIFVHGRYERPESSGSGQLHLGPTTESQGFHAGTEHAAHDRLGPDGIGAPWKGTKPVFYHGVVEPEKMKNTPAPGHWEPGHAMADQGGRIDDKDESWGAFHHDKYYRNNYEDKGSTSVVLSTHEDRDTGRRSANNFLTHRQAVSDAIQDGRRVPSHVRAVYEATGGEKGPHSVVHPHFRAPRDFRERKYATIDEGLGHLDHHWESDHKKWANPGSKFVPLPGEPGHEDTHHDYGGYGTPPF